MTSPKNPYSVRRAIFPQDRANVIEVWRGNLGNPNKLEQKFKWFYQDSPVGEPLVMLLEYAAGSIGTGQVVGVAAAGPRSFSMSDGSVDAGVLVDMAVMKEHRTLFPALLLQRELLKEARTKFQFLYGFPNAKAAPVFKRAGYRKLGMMTRYVRVIRASTYMTRLLPRILGDIIGRILDQLFLWRTAFRYRGNERLDARWQRIDEADFSPFRVGTNEILQGARSIRFLRWRFQSTEDFEYSMVTVSGSLTDEFRGYWIVESVDGVLHIRDCSVVLLQGKLAGRAWMKLFEDARARGFNSVSFECFGPSDFCQFMGSCGMWPRSERPLFGIPGASMSIDAENLDFYVTAADEDE